MVKQDRGTFAHELVKEFMKLANHQVAKTLVESCPKMALLWK